MVLLMTMPACSLFAQTFESSKLPIILINTNNQAIPDEPRITADMKIIYNGTGKLNRLQEDIFSA